MKTGKKILSMFLVVLMLFTSVPIAFAAENGTANAQTESQLTAENGMANIINNLTESDESEENNGFSIKDVIFEDNTAYVNINVAEKCSLVVAVFDEDTFEMLGSGTKAVEASTYTEDETEDIQEVEVDINTMPDHYLAKAFLLDDSYNALCKEYVCRSYTTAYEVFMDTTPSDFPNSEIVAFDDSLDDFGVINDDAIVLDKDTSYTYENGVYTFNNADEKLASLKAGDIIYIPLSDEIGDFILIKVAAVEKKGTTIIVTDDEDIALGDAFQFVRIDEDADFTDVSVDEENLGSALEVIDEEEEEVSTQSLERAEIDKTFEGTFSTKLKVKYPKSESEDKDAFEKGFGISGTFAYELKASVKLYYDIRWGDDFYEFKTELNHTVKVSVKITGKIETNKEFFKIPCTSIPVGVFMLYVDLYPVFSAEASVTLEGSLKIYNCLSFSDSSGFTKTNETKWLDGDVEVGKTEIEIKFGVAVDFDLGYKVGKEDKEGMSKVHATVGATLEAGVKAKLTPSLIGVVLDKHHDCTFCMTGSVSVYINGTATLKFKLISKKLSWSYDAVSIGVSAKLDDCYFSISENGAKFAFGTCENISYKVTVTVKDDNDDPVEGAIVSTTTGYCDADNDGKFNETSTKTNKDGQATFYFKKGKHTLTAEKNGATGDSGTFQILSNAKSTTIKLGGSGGGSSGGGSSGGGSSGGGGGSFGDLDPNPTDLDLSQSYVYFGSYPQSEVTDSATISALNALAPSWDSWTSYGYYSGTGSYGTMTQGDWMRYTDVTYNGEKYRGVKFTQYRPYYTENSTSSGTYQDDNGYYTNTVYWFKFESLKWRVLDASTGLIMCETIIDSQPYSNTIYYNSSISDSRYRYFNDSSYTHYASDYETSSIRKWLNNDFYNTAFTSADQSTIATSTLNNDGYYTLTGTTGYEKLDSNDTKDKIFLMSYDEMLNTNYGFSSSYSTYDTARRAQGSDYAKCQGLYVYTGSSYKENSIWLLRSPGSNSYDCCEVYYDGYVYYYYRVHHSSSGVRPALKLNLSSAISQSNNLKSNNPTVASYAAPVALSTTPTVFSTRSATATKSATKSDALKGSDYVLLVVKDPDSEDMLSSDNLLYIDQKTAESDTINFDYVLPTGTSTYTATIYGVSHTHIKGDPVKENEVAATCTSKGSYDEVIYCTCGKEMSRKTTTVDKLSHTYSETAKINPTCTVSGSITYSCTCGDTYTDTLPATGHTFDGSECINCGYDRADDCSCNCHKSGIVKFFFNIINFFQKLFGNNKTCDCGASH